VTARYLCDRFVEAKEAGVKALRRGDREEARRCFLQASEHLYRLAATSDGPVKESRMANARSFQELARTIAAGGDASPSASEEDFGPAPRPAVRLRDVAGLEEAKEELALRLILPRKHPEKAKLFGIRLGGGVLLFGPPGTGKTLLARAVAGEVEAPFYVVKPSEIMSKWVGEAEKNVARLFAAARAHPLAVMFIDEIEALLPKRSESRSSVMTRVVPQILSELEGFDAGEGSLLFLGATNEPWALDPAALRPGRFDAQIYVGLPEAEAREEILRLNLEGRPLGGDVDCAALAEALAGRSGADLRQICRRAAAAAFMRTLEEAGNEVITAADLQASAEKSPPSVTAAQLERFATWRAAREAEDG
jgi:transitional endoplasmic reticulum ATPase